MIETRIENDQLLKTTTRRDVHLRLFCFHYAGGNANVFRQWSKYFPNDIQVVPVELPGHGVRLGERLLESIPDAVQEIAKRFTGHLEKPFAFFGHSMGALLSFELARFLRRYFLPQPVHLFVSAHVAPHLSGQSETIHNLPDHEFMQKLKTLNGTPDIVLTDPELRSIFLPIIRNDFKVCETYSYKPGIPLDCPITIYGGTKDENVALESLTGWGQHTTADIQLRMFDGDHFFIHTNENELLHTLAKDLQQVLVNWNS